MGRSRTRVALFTAALTLACAAPAFGDTASSPNWSGYVAHHRGVRFSRVLAQWTQPGATCTPGSPSYSSIWVGLGGFEGSSRVEQIGTELDCTAAGQAVASAWYDLAPAGSKPVPIAISPGDTITADVTVAGHRVTVSLADRTSGRTFRRIVRASALDQSSADWIVEAPSSCFGPGACITQPLADFGSARFAHARAGSTTGVSGTISDPAWQSTKVQLTAEGLVVDYHAVGALTQASTSALSAGGSSFGVTFLR